MNSFLLRNKLARTLALSMMMVPFASHAADKKADEAKKEEAKKDESKEIKQGGYILKDVQISFEGGDDEPAPQLQMTGKPADTQKPAAKKVAAKKADDKKTVVQKKTAGPKPTQPKPEAAPQIPAK